MNEKMQAYKLICKKCKRISGAANRQGDWRPPPHKSKCPFCGGNTEWKKCAKYEPIPWQKP